VEARGDVMNALDGRRCLMHVVEHHLVCIPQVIYMCNTCVCVCVGVGMCVCVMCWMGMGV